LPAAKRKKKRRRHHRQLQLQLRSQHRHHHQRAMLNQIHQLLARRLLQKEEQPKANTFQFSTGFRLVSARAFARYGDEYL